MSQEDAVAAGSSTTVDDDQQVDVTTATSEADGSQDEPQQFDREYVKQLRAENAAARKARKELEARVKEFEDRDKSETERLKEQADAAERRARDAELTLLRLKVGQAKGLPVELAELLHGEDEKQMKDHADRLIKAGVAGQPTRTSFDGGAREQHTHVSDMDSLIRSAGRRT